MRTLLWLRGILPWEDDLNLNPPHAPHSTSVSLSWYKKALWFSYSDLMLKSTYHKCSPVYWFVSVSGSCRDFSDSSSCLALCSFVSLGSENPLEPLSFHFSLLSSVCRVHVERKLTSSAVMWARLHCSPLELSFQRLLCLLQGSGGPGFSSTRGITIFSAMSVSRENVGYTMKSIKPIWDSATRVLFRSHKGEEGRPSSASLSPSQR